MAAPAIWWVRKDFRLADNPSLTAAIEAGGPVVPVYILDPVTEDSLGAAPAWRLERAIETFAATLSGMGSRLILRRGAALPVLRDLAEAVGAQTIVWGRQYDSGARDRDAGIKSALKSDGRNPLSVRSHVIFEPWEIETKTGGPYKVYSPFKRACFDRATFSDPLPSPARLEPPQAWPASDALAGWGLGARMNRGAEVVARYAAVGEKAAAQRLTEFLDIVAQYGDSRDRPDRAGTSRLSENLAWGEISPLTVWHAVRGVAREQSHAKAGATIYLEEILWREFAYHLLFHFPKLPSENWREEWAHFPWRDDNEDAERWRRGMTGLPLVDAGMRELYATGYMHNRIRMLVASVLTKHLLTDWRVGEAWFRECLIDWDPASNAMGWQWSAGSGPDATPYFRIFNPETQRKRFDPKDAYVRRWISELAEGAPCADSEAFFEAIPRSWCMNSGQSYPEPVIGLSEGRERALSAYNDLKDKKAS